MVRHPPLGHSLLIIEASRSHSDAPHAIGLYWKGDQPFADLYPTKHNIYKRETSTGQAEFEPAIPASEQPQTHTLEHVATGIGTVTYYSCIFNQILRKTPKSSAMTGCTHVGIRNGHIKNKYQKRFIRISLDLN
jgi:hypothetical protein